MKTIKICGFCGTPLNDNNEPLSIDECNKLTEEQCNNATQDYGNCCPPEQEQERMRVTRDMAIDAGDLDLEGQLI